MQRVPTGVVVLGVVVFALVSAAGTAGALSVTVAEEGEEISIIVTDEGDPVREADVSISGVTRETVLDGEYETDWDGRVTFNRQQTQDLSGVVHLRITVESGGSYKSVLTTLTRSSEVGPSPMGHRMSMSLQDSVAGTRGKVEGRLATANSGEEVEATAGRVDSLLRDLGDAQFRREVLGRDLSAGEISPSEFYLEAVKNAGRSASIRNALKENVEYLISYEEERLLESGVDVQELNELHDEIQDGRIDTDRRILGEE
jgi:hypothetical protein